MTIVNANNAKGDAIAGLSLWKQAALYLISFVIVGFAQPAWIGWLGIFAASFGYALLLRVLLSLPTSSKRFWIAASWFCAIQAIQLSWFVSHPYVYIYAVYFFLCIMMGLQFGCLGIFITLKEVRNPLSLFAIAGSWTILEWFRLYLLSGFSWNPVGLALTDNLYSLQMASLWGIYGLSFWVVYVNLLAISAWFSKKFVSFAIWLCAALIPYAYGAYHLSNHQPLFEKMNQSQKAPLTVVLVQTAFPIEETLSFWGDSKQMASYVIDEWEKILQITQRHIGKPVDLIVMPEFTVPYGTYTFVFPHQIVKSTFERMFGKEALKALPPLESPLAMEYTVKEGKSFWFVSNAYWLQAISNIFQAHVIAGLEDVEGDEGETRKYFSSAQYFQPSYLPDINKHEDIVIQRYDKRVLVPMGEYIPFTWCQKLAASYGILGSFTPGSDAKVFDHPKIPFGVSICYEETFGHLMRENRQQGAELLVNLTSDIWYPNSRLIKQHFDHARLRTVENGIPLIRACNTGITGGFDSLGRVVSMLGDENYNDTEFKSDSIIFNVPQYTYSTLFTKTGDALVIILSLGAILLRYCIRPE